MDQRADRRHRITGRRDLSRAFRQGRRVSDGLMTLYAVRGNVGNGRCRLAVAVSTRLGHAVTRNRIKRLCREAFRLNRRDLPPGWDYVVVPRAGADFTVDSLAASIRSLASRIARTGREDRQ